MGKRKRVFNYESVDEPLSDPETAFKVQCFNQVVDKALQTLEPRFKQLRNHHNLFRILCSFQELTKDEIRKSAADIQVALTDAKLRQENQEVKTIIFVDIDGYMLSEEIEALKPIMPPDLDNPMSNFEFLTFNNRYTAFSNLFIALRILLTIPVTVDQEKEVFLSSNLSKLI